MGLETRAVTSSFGLERGGRALAEEGVASHFIAPLSLKAGGGRSAWRSQSPRPPRQGKAEQWRGTRTQCPRLRHQLLQPPCAINTPVCASFKEEPQEGGCHSPAQPTAGGSAEVWVPEEGTLGKGITGTERRPIECWEFARTGKGRRRGGS